MNISSPATFKAKPTNFLASTEGPSIRGEFVIDPSIRLPPSLLPLLGEGETEQDRKNLSLTSMFSINTDIWLLSSSSGESVTGMRKPQCTTIVLTSEFGSIHAQLVRLSVSFLISCSRYTMLTWAQHALDGAAPFLLTAHASLWGVYIYLPRSFQGLLLLSTGCNVTLSDPLLENATQLSKLHSTRQYFVGDIQALREEEWEGSRVVIEALRGPILVKYVDEVAAQGKGFFGWLFGK